MSTDARSPDPRRSPVERIRRLQRIQIITMAAIVLAIIAASLFISRRVLTAGDERAKIEEVEHTLIDLRDRLRIQALAYWRDRALGGSGFIGPEIQAEYLAGAVVASDLIASRSGEPGEEAITAEAAAVLARLRRDLFEDQTGLVIGSPREIARTTRREASLADAERVLTTWVGIIERKVTDRGRADDRLITRFVALLAGLIAALVAAGTALWLALGKAHRNVVRELATERDATSTVIASVQDGLAVVDATGKVVRTNDRLSELTGLDRTALLGKPPPWAVDIPDDFTGERDLELSRPHGDARAVIVSVAPLATAEGGGAVHVLKDVTDRKRSEVRLRELASEQDALRRVATAVAAAVEPKEVFDLVAREIATMLGTEVGVVTRFDALAARAVDVGVWVKPDADVEPPPRLPLDGGAPIARTYRTGQVSRVDDLATIDRRTAELFRAHGLAGAVAAPVVVGSERWGAVGALTTTAGGIPAGSEVRLARFAELVGLTVANADARARLASQAATDPLTGLANHRSFHERLEFEVARARAEGGELALVVFDLDRFKDINDAFGHQVGDEVLAEAARRLAGEARFGELVARVGGEEFAWILPGSDGINAWRAAERARRSIAAKPFGAGVGTLTASSGVADLTQAVDAATLIKLADGALYWAKAQGRNVTLRYSPEVVQELSMAERAERLARSQGVTALRALARAVDAKDPSTARHAERVAAIAVRLGAELGWPQEQLVMLEEAALLHDVGKIGVPDAILFKADPLTPAEFEEITVHAALGAEIVSDVLTPEQVAWVRGHHERWDGGGYPDGLAGESITGGARILAVADAWDAMTSVRVYGTPRTPDEAIAEVRSESGRQFAPEVAAALATLWEAGRLTTTEIGSVGTSDG